MYILSLQYLKIAIKDNDRNYLLSNKQPSTPVLFHSNKALKFAFFKALYLQNNAR